MIWWAEKTHQGEIRQNREAIREKEVRRGTRGTRMRKIGKVLEI